MNSNCKEVLQRDVDILGSFVALSSLPFSYNNMYLSYSTLRKESQRTVKYYYTQRSSLVKKPRKRL